MVQANYRNKMKSILVPEMIGALVCLLGTILPVMGKLIGGADLFKMTSLWYWYAIGFPFFYFYTRRVFKCYGRTAGTASPALDPTDL